VIPYIVEVDKLGYAIMIPTLYDPPRSGTERLRQILAASRLAISLWRGTASTTPVAGLHHKE
jgi:hypothetical protein